MKCIQEPAGGRCNSLVALQATLPDTMPVTLPDAHNTLSLEGIATSVTKHFKMWFLLLQVHPNICDDQENLKQCCLFPIIFPKTLLEAQKLIYDAIETCVIVIPLYAKVEMENMDRKFLSFESSLHINFFSPRKLKIYGEDFSAGGFPIQNKRVPWYMNVNKEILLGSFLEKYVFNVINFHLHIMQKFDK